MSTLPPPLSVPSAAASSVPLRAPSPPLAPAAPVRPPRIPGIRLLHAPGPTRVPDEVLQAMSRQPTDLADPRVNQLIAGAENGLRWLVQSADADIFLYSANGHGIWEACIANLVAPGVPVLVPGTGVFSDGWAEQVQALGGVALRTPYTEGQTMDLAAVEATLREDMAGEAPRIAAVFAVHTDTASGTTHDLAAVRRAIDAAGHPALFVIDAVASLAVEPLAMDALGADVVLGASQKGLMLQPGMAFAAVRPRAFAAAQANPTPRHYWDWVLRRSDHQYRKFCGTPPLAHLAGLEVSLGLIASEGLDHVIARHRRIAAAVHAAVEAWSTAGALKLFTRTPAARAAAVTAIEVAPGIDPEALRSVARERFGVAIAGGLGPYNGRVFRIGHLGDVNEAMILGALAGVQAAMTAQGVPHGPGGMDAAIAVLTGSH